MHTTLSPGRLQRALLVALLSTLTSCTCGGKKTSTAPAPNYAALLKALPRAAVSRPQAVMPRTLFDDPSFTSVVTLATGDARGSYDAFLTTDLGKALVAGGAIEHLKLSSQLESALSVGHELATASAYPLAADKLADALAGPAVFGFAVAADRTAFVAVKEVDASQEAVVRLALMSASMRTGAGASVEVEDYGGVKVSQLTRGAKPLWVAAFQNVVIVASHQDLVHAAVDLATGKGTASVEELPAFKAETDTLKGPQTAAVLRLDPSELLSTLTDVSELVVRVELSPAVITLHGAIRQAPDRVAGLRALASVPQGAAFFTSLGAANPDRVLARLGEATDAAEALKIPAPMMASVSDEAFYALTDVERGRFNHLVGLGLKDQAAAAKALPGAAKTWMSAASPRSFAGGVTGFCNSGGGLCVAVTQDFLLASNDEATLKSAVETSLGKHPSLADVKGFAQVAKAGEPRYLTTYLSAERASDVAQAFFVQVAQRSSQAFDVGDVGETVGPLCKALRGLPPVGGRLDLTGTTLAGELRPLPAP